MKIMLHGNKSEHETKAHLFNSLRYKIDDKNIIHGKVRAL